MKNNILALCSTVVLVASSLIFTTSTMAKTLSGAEIQEQIIGKRVDWVLNDGAKGTTRYRKSGKSTVTVKSPNRFRDKGTWRIKGNKLCSTWTEIRGGEERCFSFKTTNKPGVFKGARGTLTVK